MTENLMRRLLKIESGVYDINSQWNRNPDGAEAFAVIEELLQALRDAVQEIEDLAEYSAPEYAEKMDLRGTLNKFKDLIARIENQTR